ncbi:MAG TPA: TRAM domain-containing protein, partial [Thermoanaerobaculia bacterium]|nr:TRAM domain-containing protein [Thermoanaerobaculia bacterium]
MKTGDEITIAPAELVAGGAALARIDGFPIFVTNIFPGDVAIVRLTEVKKGFARAELVRIVVPSALRRAAPCPIAEECGGCDWTALRLDHQLEAKKKILVESLRRIGKIYEHPPIAIHASPLNYRLRSRLQSDGDAVGFYAMGSHRVVPLAAECEVVGVETARVFGGGQATLPVRTDKIVCPPLSAWEIDGRLIVGDAELTIGVDGFTYHLSTSSFFQVNRHQLAPLLHLVTGHASRVQRRELAVDLYAGVGFFTLPLSQMFDRVIAVEASRDPYTTIDITQAAVEDFEMPKADFIFLDPPRAGTLKSVVE